jgi:hypothetical protein
MKSGAAALISPRVRQLSTLNRHPALAFCLSMIFPKTGTHPRIKSEGMLFGIML